MKIAFFVDSLQIGGAEVLTVQLSSTLIAAGHEVSVIGLGKGNSLLPLLQKNNIAYHCLDCPRGISVISMWKLFRFLTLKKIDIIISHHFRQLLHGWLPAIASKTVHCHIEHDNLIYRNSIKYQRLLSILSYRLHQFIVISPNLQQWYSQHLKHIAEKIVLIPNGIDTDIFHPSLINRQAIRNRYNIEESALVLGTCARLEPIKNIEAMIHIFHGYLKGNPSARLLVVGDGSCKARLLELTQDLNVDDSVIFAGMQTEVAPLLQAMDIYLLTSLDEGLPLSVIEAMACGLPVAASSVGGVPDILRKEYGRSLKTYEVPEWQTAIDQLLKIRCPETGQCKSARSAAITNFSSKKSSEAYLDLISNISIRG